MIDSIGWLIIASISLSFLPLVLLVVFTFFFPKLGGVKMDDNVMGANVWDREGLRRTLVEQCDTLRKSVVWRWMSAEQKELNVTARTFWSTDSVVVNNALDAFAAILNGDK
jgi:hypothetical protein